MSNQQTHSFPVFWRSPLNTQGTDMNNNMALNDDIHVMTAAENSVIKGTTEHRNHAYMNQPEGEMDMMIGFFLMNGVCIVFFLLFGLCVIFSCLRNFSCCKSKFAIDIEQNPSPAPSNFKPKKFKSFVQQVVKSKALVTDQKKTDVILQVDSLKEGKTSEQSTSSASECRRKSVENGSRRSSRADASAVIRHNLLGPLSFDDLYYM